VHIRPTVIALHTAEGIDRSSQGRGFIVVSAACFRKEPAGLRPVFSRDAMIAGVRIDKWLWAARFFKTRSLAGRACDLGRIESNGQPAKAAREVRVGDLLRVKTEGGEFHLEVLGVDGMRGPAAAAQALYRETEASRELRLKLAAERKAMFLAEGLPQGRPSKRDRRQIHRFREMG
jgi:ribosome-associated heat shock protein Hsp15